jgi:amino acid transporter
MNLQAPNPVVPATVSRLARELGPVLATAVVVGTVIGSGIFKKPQTVAANIPYFGLTASAWVLGGVLALLGALAYAEVATLLPRAGGNYVFLREGYGRLAGFLFGWVEFFIIRSASLAALATIFTQSFHAVLSELSGRVEFPDWMPQWLLWLLLQPDAPEGRLVLRDWLQRAITVSVILGLSLVNARGVKWGGVLQLLITIIKVGSLVFIAVLPFLVLLLPTAFSATTTPTTARLQPAWPAGDEWHVSLLSGFATAMLAVLWSYHGWMNIAPVAEEVKQPQRNIPLALIGGVGLLILLYLSVNLAYCMTLSQTDMSHMKQGAVDETVAIGFARQLLGSVGVTLAAAAVMCSVFGALNGNILVGPRLLYAMSEDGLAPRALGEVHARYRTPVVAILVLAAWSSLLVVGVAVLTWLGVLREDKDHFDVLTDFAMFGAVIFETMAVLSIFVFRRTLAQAPRPYRCIGYPVVPLLYVILPVFILASMFLGQTREVAIGCCFIAVGVLVYFAIDRRRLAAQRRPAGPAEDLRSF